jgi:hypothetical protein
VIPTGYSFNLDGTSIYLTMAAVFIAQATNTPLDLFQQITLLVVLLISSKGAAGVTGSGFIVLAATISAVGHLPLAGLALILGIDRFMSEARALTNLIGNGVATLVVAKYCDQLDEQKMNEVLANPVTVEGRTARIAARRSRGGGNPHLAAHKKTARVGRFFMVQMTAEALLQALGEGTGDHVTLLFRGQGVETHGVAGDADGQLRVLFRVGDGVFQGLAAQHVDVQVLTTLRPRARSGPAVHGIRTGPGQKVADFLIGGEAVALGADAASLLLLFVQQPERVQQSGVGGLGDLDALDHGMTPHRKADSTVSTLP